MRKFDYSFLKQQIPSETMQLLLTYEQLSFNGKSLSRDYPRIFEALKEVALVQSIQSSNAIEGIVTTDQRINQLVLDKVSPINHNEMEIAGYRDVLNEIYNNSSKYNFVEKDILSMHQILLSYLDHDLGGKYKQNDNAIIEIDSNGHRRLRFKLTSARETPMAMEQLCLAYLDQSNDVRINQILLIPCVILDFLSIHPFSDGNGRLSRLLSILLLVKKGVEMTRYVSFENQINLHKNAYYLALKQSSLNWEEGSNDYFPFINNFLITLIRTLRELTKRFSILTDQKLTKADRIKQSILNSPQPISKHELAFLWPDISGETLNKVLGKLVKNKTIKRIGMFKNAKYIAY